MNIFETLGQAQMLLGEANRQLAFAFASRARKLARLLGETLRHTPSERLYPF